MPDPVLPDRTAMPIPIQGGNPGPVERATICWEMLRTEQLKATEQVITAIHRTADERGQQIVGYLDETKRWIKDMKEIAGS